MHVKKMFFWILDALMKKPKYNLADIFTNGMSRLHLALYQTDMALKKSCTEITCTFRRIGNHANIMVTELDFTVVCK